MAFSQKTFLLPLFFFFFFFFSILSLSFSKPNSLSFPLTTVSLSRNPSSDSLYSSSLSSNPTKRTLKQPTPFNYKLPFKYSTVLVVSLPIGTPPQLQDMILDTGSQLSWIRCNNNKKTPPVFDPSLSSSFSLLPCLNRLCKPRIPDFTLPTSCDQHRFCHYSYFYADGTLAEGNLVREKFTFSSSFSTPPLILGCAQSSDDDKGILGMNNGRLSFVSQTRISKFSYCVPSRMAAVGSDPTGSFFIGDNPNSVGFQYVNMLTFSESQRLPNLDPLAYTVPMRGIRIGGKMLNIPAAVFQPDTGGSGQTIVDSGSDLSYFVDEAYNIVRAEIVRLVGPMIKKGYVYAGVADMCFDGDAIKIGRLIGDMALLFDKGVEILIPKERVLSEVERGIKCVGIGRSNLLGISSNIIGNFHQQNMWVEFDLTNKRIGFGRADCTGSK